MTGRGVQTASADLRARTRDDHEAIEAALDLRQLRSAGGLSAMLLGWVDVWNQIAAALVDPGAATVAKAELRLPAAEALGWLAADLVDLNSASRELPTYRESCDTDDLRQFLAHAPSSWGFAYVLRGSRLGGSVLAPRVRGALALQGDGGTRFLASRGTNPGREWVSFRRRLDAADLSATELTAAVDAARWAFRWIGAATAANPRPPALAVHAR